LRESSENFNSDQKSSQENKATANHLFFSLKSFKDDSSQNTPPHLLTLTPFQITLNPVNLT